MPWNDGGSPNAATAFVTAAASVAPATEPSSPVPPTTTMTTVEEDVSHRRVTSPSTTSTTPARFGFYHGTRLVYEWEQTLEELVLTVPGVPRGVPLLVDIAPSHLRIGVRGASTYFLDEGTGGMVDVAESTWTRDNDDQLLVVYLQKAHRGVVWEQALKRFDCRLDPHQLEEVRQDLLRERWTQESPGMDFSSATFNGQAPDPRTFMGGCSYDN